LGAHFLGEHRHVGVVCRERPGFLVNRIQFAMLAEIYRIVDEGYATPEDIDQAVRNSLGPRLALWGPLLCEDLVVSKSTALAVTKYLSA
jgi:3-hydroxybutyryl-CoA dehydrogenase